MEKKTFLEVKNLVVEYTSDRKVIHAVNGLSLTLAKGKTLGLVGETGAGKTTVAKTILRILPDHGARVISGEVRLQGVNLMELPEDKMRKVRGAEIAMVFQDPMTALNPIQRVGYQIAEAVMHHSDYTKRQAEDKAVEMLKLVGISEDRFMEYPHQFSGGMKQRVVIAMALACNPQLLLADEPTTALDVTIQAQVLEMISQLRDELGTSMILITHDMGVVAQTCDDVAVMYAGEIIEHGTKEQIFDHPTHPYTVGLFNAIPSMNTDEEYLHPIDGLPPDPSNLPKGCNFSPRCPYADDMCRQSEFIPEEMTEDGHMCRCLRFKEITMEKTR